MIKFSMTAPEWWHKQKRELKIKNPVMQQPSIESRERNWQCSLDWKDGILSSLSITVALANLAYQSSHTYGRGKMVLSSECVRLLVRATIINLHHSHHYYART